MKASKIFTALFAMFLSLATITPIAHAEDEHADVDGQSFLQLVKRVDALESQLENHDRQLVALNAAIGTIQTTMEEEQDQAVFAIPAFKRDQYYLSRNQKVFLAKVAKQLIKGGYKIKKIIGFADPGHARLAQYNQRLSANRAQITHNYLRRFHKNTLSYLVSRKTDRQTTSDTHIKGGGTTNRFNQNISDMNQNRRVVIIAKKATN